MEFPEPSATMQTSWSRKLLHHVFAVLSRAIVNKHLCFCVIKKLPPRAARLFPASLAPASCVQHRARTAKKKKETRLELRMPASASRAEVFSTLRDSGLAAEPRFHWHCSMQQASGTEPCRSEVLPSNPGLHLALAFHGHHPIVWSSAVVHYLSRGHM